MTASIFCTPDTYRAVPTRSLQFDGTNSLSMSNSDWGAYNRNKFGFFTHIRPTSLVNGDNLILEKENEFFIGIQSNKLLAVVFTATSTGQKRSTADFATGAYKQIGFTYDSSQAAADRLQIFINGVRVTSLDISSDPAAEAAATTANSITISGTNPYTGYVYQPFFVSGTIPAIGDIYDGHAKDVRNITGAYSLLETDDVVALEDDYLLTPNWTNNGSVTKSTVIPS